MLPVNMILMQEGYFIFLKKKGKCQTERLIRSISQAERLFYLDHYFPLNLHPERCKSLSITSEITLVKPYQTVQTLSLYN